MKGIDVSYAQGLIDWDRVRAAGVEFAMIKVSQGKLLADPSVGPFTDPQFIRNIEGAFKSGVPIGVYHYLCAGTVEESLAEADYFIKTISPYKDKITLWAACDAEEYKYLPSDKKALTSIVHGFLKKVRAAGFKPMLYSNPDYLTYRLNDLSIYDLWLAYWNASEARVKAYNPKIWQHGTGRVNGITDIVDVNKGYFSLPVK